MAPDRIPVAAVGAQLVWFQEKVETLQTACYGGPVAYGQLWEAFHNCPYRRSIVMEGNYNLSRYHLAFCLNSFS